MATINKLTIRLIDDGRAPVTSVLVDAEVAIPNYVAHPQAFPVPLTQGQIDALAPVLAQIRAGVRAYIGNSLTLDRVNADPIAGGAVLPVADPPVIP